MAAISAHQAICDLATDGIEGGGPVEALMAVVQHCWKTGGFGVQVERMEGSSKLHTEAINQTPIQVSSISEHESRYLQFEVSTS